ncbi:MAG: TonB-dependent receptor [Candidatus Melainabacteria bacterium]|nr:TonB-dependent receptor [Candidatus Melainabacteria bacterium]
MTTLQPVKAPPLRAGCLQGIRHWREPLLHLPLKDPGVNAGVCPHGMICHSRKVHPAVVLFFGVCLALFLASLAREAVAAEGLSSNNGHSRVWQQEHVLFSQAKTPSSDIDLYSPDKASALVKGTVRAFSDDRPIANALVVVIRADAEERRFEATSAADGSFTLSGLETGDWTLTVSAEGMLSASQKILLALGETKVVRILLADLEAEEILRITGKRTLIHPDNIGSTTNLGKNFIREYRSGNDLRNLITTTPGVMPDSYGNIIVRGEHDALNYELDGAVLPESAGVLQQSQFVTPRSLESMRVDIGGYQAKDGGGPLGAVVRMKSLPIKSKPTFNIGGQLGGPLAGNITFYASGAVSQDPKSILHRLKFEASGQTVGTSLGLSPPVKHFVRNGRADLNYLGKLEFAPSEKDTIRLTALFNESFMQLPTSGTSRGFGVRMSQHDRQDLAMVSYHRRFDKYLDQLNLHIINAFYSERVKSRNAFDPLPLINGEEGSANSVSPLAKRFNYVFSAQGDVSKTLFNTHKLTAGFLSEVRPVRTQYAGLYYNADLLATFAAQEQARLAGDTLNTNPLPYAASISPFTGAPGGPLFVGNIGRFRGLRYLQSAYLQDSWRPTTGVLKRLTLDAGVRVDVYHGVFGDTLKVSEAIATIPDVPMFSLQPFQKQRVTDAQASGRFGGALVLTKNTVLRGSFANIFQPPPVDVLVQPPQVSQGPINGIFNGTVRPLRAIRGQLVDVSIEQQIGPRFVTRTNLFYKKLKNFGDSGVIPNTPIYNRLSLSNLESYGIETRMDLKPDGQGYGFNGFLSNTVAVAKLAGCKCITGGVYEVEEGAVLQTYPDHDRRYTLSAGLGYKARSNMWILGDVSVYTGLPDRNNPLFFGPQPARTPVRTMLGVSAGYKLPQKWRQSHRLMPASVDVRIDNILNQRLPINLGSPFQGTRFSLPIRVLAGMNWEV